jgi:hypothetical protein
MQKMYEHTNDKRLEYFSQQKQDVVPTMTTALAIPDQMLLISTMMMCHISISMAPAGIFVN